MRNRYLIASIFLLSVFIIMALFISPRTNPNINSEINTDKTIYLYINNLHFKPINQLMIYLSLYGREVVWAIVIILLFILGGSAGKKTAVILSITLIALIPIGTIAKQVIERPRPVIPISDFLISSDTDFSFPSGHAVIVSAGAAIVLSLFRNSVKQWAISLILTLEAALVCFSRIYVGAHYPLDIVGGILLGVGVSFIFIWKEKEIILGFQKVITKLKR